uniref:Uncharacterized protein n=1 Tax=Arundo donax TaxID=35708 RepID=A0A0A8Y453_ARUDO
MWPAFFFRPALKFGASQECRIAPRRGAGVPRPRVAAVALRRRRRGGLPDRRPGVSEVRG